MEPNEYTGEFITRFSKQDYLAPFLMLNCKQKPDPRGGRNKQ